MNLALGVFFHWLGGLASASFYIPYRGVKRWSWETYWIVGGVFSWVIAPSVLGSLLVPDLFSHIASAPRSSLMWSYIFGILWGIGGLTFGLTMRYLGIALGMAVALGFCAAFGTLMPPIFDGKFGELLASSSGITVLAGVLACLVGIAISGAAGMSKEKELSQEEKAAAIKEFDFKKGMLVAVFAGVMSSCFAYGLAAGKPLGEITKVALEASGGSLLWQNLPVLVVVLWGGFTTNFIWCLILNIRNRSSHEYLNMRPSHISEMSEAEGMMISAAPEIAANREAAAHGASTGAASYEGRAPLLRNYFFCAVAGVTWYLQFFFYSMGETKMGAYTFSSWTLHMASIIIFSTIWGIFLHEWRGSSRKTMNLVFLGLLILVASTVIVGYGNYLGGESAGH
jgi:L-rhamnose-H+ transport protein